MCACSVQTALVAPVSWSVLTWPVSTVLYVEHPCAAINLWQSNLHMHVALLVPTCMAGSSTAGAQHRGSRTSGCSAVDACAAEAAADIGALYDCQPGVTVWLSCSGPVALEAASCGCHHKHILATWRGFTLRADSFWVLVFVLQASLW